MVRWDPDRLSHSERANTCVAVARTVGPGGPNDVTSYHPGQHLWDDSDNLPEILYDLRPPSDLWYTFKNSGLPHQKLDGNSNPVFEQHPEPGTAPRPLLDFKILASSQPISDRLLLISP